MTKLIENIITTLGNKGYDAMYYPFGGYLQVSSRKDSDYLTIFNIDVKELKDEKSSIKLIIRELNKRIREDL